MNTITPVSRQIINRKLLTALEDKGTVAIVASEEDLKVMIEALSGYASDHRTGIKSELRMSNLAADLQQLMAAAFPRRK